MNSPRIPVKVQEKVTLRLGLVGSDTPSWGGLWAMTLKPGKVHCENILTVHNKKEKHKSATNHNATSKMAKQKYILPPMLGTM